ncbi:hypothetical protein [Nodularia spumigena]|jgi:hypothetical protein|uniref:hypothetical protein n=1 Tax=Nodularia spumigena TaxID=70799 RepID=UPI002B1FE755|nr:hypothetical protein [Nodularia spumigena]MEA5615505.1 hypothetical protein [Nodularia spumigena UHCC 0040]
MKSKIIFNLSVFLILFGVNLLPVNAQKNTIHRVNSNKNNNQIYIGIRYRHNFPGYYLNYPKGIQHLGGWVVDDPGNLSLDPGHSIATPEYGISQVKKGNQEMLWFEILVDRDRNGNPNRWLVLDVFNVPKIDKSYTMVGHGGSCLRNGISDIEIIAIAKLEDTEELRQIQKAWRANRKTRKFEAISTKGVICFNTGSGD